MILITDKAHNNLFLTQGKVGTSTLVSLSTAQNVSKFDNDIVPEIVRLLDSKYRDQKQFLIIREPLDRFKSGLLQILLYELPFNLNDAFKTNSESFHDLYYKNLTSEMFWIQLIHKYFDIIGFKQNNIKSRIFSYHCGLWLEMARTIYKSRPDAIKIIHLSKLSKLLEHLEYTDPVHYNNSNEMFRFKENEVAQIKNTFLHALYKNELFIEYINSEQFIKEQNIYKELLELQYVIS